MNVYEIKLNLYLLKDIRLVEATETISQFIDQGLAKTDELLTLHNKNCFKYYTFNLLYPLENDQRYKKDRIYTLMIRTVDARLAKFFNEELVHQYDRNMKGLTSQIRIIPRKMIEKIYSITPVILKSEQGYWKGNLTFEEYENRLKSNLIKKYNNYMNTKIDENFPLYDSIEFINGKPIGILYKDIKLLGDKLSLAISTDKWSQELAYFSLGAGVLENNSRGAGFMNYRWI